MPATAKAKPSALPANVTIRKLTPAADVGYEK